MIRPAWCSMDIKRIILLFFCWLGACLFTLLVSADTTPPSEMARAFINETWPNPGLMVYVPKAAKSLDVRRNDYDDGLATLEQGQFLAAAVKFSKVDKSIPDNGDLPAKALCSFAAGSSYLLAGKDSEAVLKLRGAIGALSKKYKDTGLDSWFNTPVGYGELHSYHIWNNLIVAYLQAGPLPDKDIGTPWTRKYLKDGRNELARDAQQTNSMTPHTTWLLEHQKRTSSPVHLAFANSNLERIYQDRSNIDNSLLLQYTSATVLLDLGDKAGLKLLRHLLEDGPKDDALLIRALNDPIEALTPEQLQTHILASAFYWALLVGDSAAATDLLGKIKTDKDKAELALLAFNADVLIKKSAAVPIDQKISESGAETMRKVLATPALVFLHPEAEQALNKLQPKYRRVPGSKLVWTWFKQYGVLLNVLLVALVMIAWICMRWRIWNNNVYYWRMLNHCSREPDILGYKARSDSKIPFDKPELE
jgi:hypothetical protein